MSDDTSTSKLSSGEIAVLNAARAILKERGEVSYGASSSEIRCAVKAEVAEHTIFEFLNWTNAYLNIQMTHEQLHMTPAPVYDEVEA